MKGLSIPLATSSLKKYRYLLQHQAFHDPRTVLIILTILVTTVSIINTAQVYDDLYLPDRFQKLYSEHGWLKAALLIFFGADLPNEYRTYGISRLLQFSLWTIVGITPWIYSFFISISQGITAIVLNKFLRLHGAPQIFSLAASIIWLVSPFSSTTCFHHYAYLIFPYQITFLTASILISNQLKIESIPFYFLVVVGGIIIGLTGEQHLIAAIVLLIISAFASHSKIVIKATFYTIVAAIISIITHYSIWRLIYANLQVPQRYYFKGNPFISFFENVFIVFKSFYLGLTIEVSVIIKYSGFIITLIVTLIIIIAFIKLFFIHRSINNNLSIYFPTRLSSRFFISIGLVFFSSFIVIFLVEILTGQIGEILPRRYGYIPYTLLIIFLLGINSFLIRKGLPQYLIYGLIIGYSFGLFCQLQLGLLPLIRLEDNRVKGLIKSLATSGKYEGVLFINSFESPFPPETPKPWTSGLRSTNDYWVFESIFSFYWTQSVYTRNNFGVPATGGTFMKANDTYIDLIQDSNSIHFVPIKLIAVIANLSPDPDQLKMNIKIFKDWDDFKQNYFRFYIQRHPDFFNSDLERSICLDLGNSISNSQNNIWPDKIWSQPITFIATNESLISNYGLVDGEDKTYIQPGHPAMDYFRSNRHGSFTYRIDFNQTEWVTIDIDIWDIWNRKIGERKFTLDVAWDGNWIELGDIDPASISDGKPFSIQFVRFQPTSFQIKVKPAKGAIDVPFMNGIRISSHPSH